MDDIPTLIQKLSGKKTLPFVTLQATVTAVDWDNRQCTVETDEEYEIDNVRLRSLQDGNTYGFCYKPTVNSKVLVTIIYNQKLNAFVSQFSQVDTLSLVDSNGTEIFNADVANGKFVFNGGENGYMVIMQHLVDKINRLENTMTNHQHTAPPGGGVTTTNDSQTIAPLTQASDLQNENIKQ